MVKTAPPREPEATMKPVGSAELGNRSPVRDWPIFMLIRTRLLEFSRRPAAVFWTYVFPLVMMFILGSAFRSQGESQSQVAIVAGEQGSRLQATLKASPELAVTMVSPDEGLRMLRSGRLALLIRASDRTDESSRQESERWEFVYDPQRPGGRLAELLVREQIRVESGFVDEQHVEGSVQRTGRTVYRLFGPWFDRHGAVGRWFVGSGLCDCRYANSQTAEAILGDPNAKERLLAGHRV